MRPSVCDLEERLVDYDSGKHATGETHRLPVVDDVAQCFGATNMRRKPCGLTAIRCTSFPLSEPLNGYGNIGACFPDDEEMSRRMREICVHGQRRASLTPGG
jgi:UDP-2-acetamido-2-deoxy-ribo-hexuluronate aminotransferase